MSRQLGDFQKSSGHMTLFGGQIGGRARPAGGHPREVSHIATDDGDPTEKGSMVCSQQSSRSLPPT